MRPLRVGTWRKIVLSLTGTAENHNMDATYEELREKARQTSITCGYGAVIEVVNYMTGRSRTTVAGGRDPIRTLSRGCEFRGVVAQYRKGEPCPI